MHANSSLSLSAAHSPLCVSFSLMLELVTVPLLAFWLCVGHGQTWVHILSFVTHPSIFKLFPFLGYMYFLFKVLILLLQFRQQLALSFFEPQLIFNTVPLFSNPLHVFKYFLELTQASTCSLACCLLGILCLYRINNVFWLFLPLFLADLCYPTPPNFHYLVAQEEFLS